MLLIRAIIEHTEPFPSPHIKYPSLSEQHNWDMNYRTIQNLLPHYTTLSLPSLFETDTRYLNPSPLFSWLHTQDPKVSAPNAGFFACRVGEGCLLGEKTLRAHFRLQEQIVFYICDYYHYETFTIISFLPKEKWTIKYYSNYPRHNTDRVRATTSNTLNDCLPNTDTTWSATYWPPLDSTPHSPHTPFLSSLLSSLPFRYRGS